jgi:hypothetical protein
VAARAAVNFSLAQWGKKHPSSDLPAGLKIDIEDQSELIQLLIRALTGDVLMVIVGIEFGMLASRQEAAGVKRCSAEFVVLALIKKLAAHVRRRIVVRVAA